MLSIAFLGAGNMAQAIMGGLIASGDDYRITAYDPHEPCREAAASMGASVAGSNTEAIRDADLVMLCVKPNVMLELANDIRDAVSSQVLISVAAGITTASLLEHLPARCHLVRCMPNTPALVRTGMTALYASSTVTEEEKRNAESVLAAVGDTLWVDTEDQLDAVTAVSGSGPAYYFLVMETMIAAGVAEGLSEDVATRLVLQTALGAAQMAKNSEHDPETLRKQVTSPGGTTQAAIETFMDKGLPATVSAAVKAARTRSIELSKG